MKPISHKDGDKIQHYEDHVSGVYGLMRDFVGDYYPAELIKEIAEIHDIGKLKPEWQEYVLSGGISPGHTKESITNATTALSAYVAANHHNGLGSSVTDFITSNNISLPLGFGKDQTNYYKIKVLFSALVDADYTQVRLWSGRNDHTKPDDLEKLYLKYKNYISKFGTPKTKINKIRNKILFDCLSAAETDDKIMRLTVPVGGGKTLSSLGYALKKAIRKRLNRIIIVVPYTAIITQTANELRQIFGHKNVLEHHSNMDVDNYVDFYRLDHWDYPIIVTTNVRFFDMPYIKKSRQLHRWANSLVIIDEYQDVAKHDNYYVYRDLIDTFSTKYNTHWLLMSATLPDLDYPEINTDVRGVYKEMTRVSYEYLTVKTITDIVSHIDTNKSTLIVVPKRNDVSALYHTLVNEFDNTIIAVSNNMTQSHKAKKIEEIKARLSSGEKIIAVSTNLIEAGVDVSFEVGYRFTSIYNYQIDSPIQTAGRINRHGELDTGILYIVNAVDDKGIEPIKTDYNAPNAFAEHQTKRYSLWKEMMDKMTDWYEELPNYRYIESSYTAMVYVGDEDPAELTFGEIVKDSIAVYRLTDDQIEMLKDCKMEIDGMKLYCHVPLYKIYSDELGLDWNCGGYII